MSNFVEFPTLQKKCILKIIQFIRKITRYEVERIYVQNFGLISQTVKIRI